MVMYINRKKLNEKEICAGAHRLTAGKHFAHLIIEDKN